MSVDSRHVPLRVSVFILRGLEMSHEDVSFSTALGDKPALNE
jgi:hypothetical protein